MSAEAQINIDVNTQGAQNSLDKFQGAIDTLGGSVEVVFGSLALFGVENEWISNLEQGAVGAIALADGTKRMTEGIIKFTGATTLAEAAQAAFNAVAALNPYVLLGAAIVAAAGALFLFKQRAKQAAEEARKLREEVAKQNFDTIKNIQLAKVQLKNEKNLREYQARVSTKTVKELNADIAVGNTRIEEQTAVVDQQVIALENLDKQFQRQATALQANFDARKISTEQYDEESKALQQRTDDAKADIEFNIERARIAIEQNEAYIGVAAAEIEARGELAEARRDQTQAEREAAAERAIIAKEQRDALIADAIALEDELFLLRLSAQDREETEAQQLFDDRVARANGNADLIKQAEEQLLTDLSAIRQRYADEQTAKDKEAADEAAANAADTAAKAKEEADKLVEIEKTRNEAIAAADEDLYNAKQEFAAAGLAALSAIAGENEQLQNAIFAVEKAVAIGDIITRLQAEKAANAAYGAALGPAGAAYTATKNTAANIRAAASIATIVAATISKYKGGGSGGLGGGASETTPGFILGSSIPGQNQQNVNAPNVQAGGPIQAYVLAGDVSSGLEAEQKFNSRRKL